MTPDDETVGFRHDPEHVRAVVDALAEHVAGGDRAYFRARDLALDPPNPTVGSVLALIADQPEDVAAAYEIAVDVEVDRYGVQPKGTVWVVRPR